MGYPWEAGPRFAAPHGLAAVTIDTYIKDDKRKGEKRYRMDYLLKDSEGVSRGKGSVIVSDPSMLMDRFIDRYKWSHSLKVSASLSQDIYWLMDFLIV